MHINYHNSTSLCQKDASHANVLVENSRNRTFDFILFETDSISNKRLKKKLKHQYQSKTSITVNDKENKVGFKKKTSKINNLNSKDTLQVNKSIATHINSPISVSDTSIRKDAITSLDVKDSIAGLKKNVTKGNPVHGGLSVAVRNASGYESNASSPVFDFNGLVTTKVAGLPLGFEANYTSAKIYGLNTNSFRFFLDVSEVKKEKSYLNAIEIKDRKLLKDSLLNVRTASKGAFLFCKQRMFEDSLLIAKESYSLEKLKNKHQFDINKPEIVHPDSSLSAPDPIKNLETKIDYHKHRYDSLQQIYNSKLDIYSQTQLRLDSLNKVDSLGADYSKITAIKNKRPSRLKKFDWSGFNELEIGRVNPSPTQLLINTPPVYGVNATYESSQIMLGGAVGKQMRINQFSLLNSESQAVFAFPAAEAFIKEGRSNYNDFVMLKGGVRKSNGDHIHVYATHIKGSPLYQTFVTGDGKHTNNGLEVEFVQSISKESNITVGISSSHLEDATVSNETAGKYEFGKNYAAFTGINFNLFKTGIKLNGNVRYISPEYTSYANPFIIKDQLRYQLIASRTFGNKLSVSAGAEREQRNVSSEDLPQIALLRFRASLKLRIGSAGMLMYNFVPTEYQVEADQSLTEKKYYNHSMAFTSRFKLFHVQHYATAFASLVVLPAWNDEPSKQVKNYGLTLSQNISKRLIIEYRGTYGSMESPSGPYEVTELFIGCTTKINEKLQLKLSNAVRITNRKTENLPGASLTWNLYKRISLTASCYKTAPLPYGEPLQFPEFSPPDYLLKAGINYTF